MAGPLAPKFWGLNSDWPDGEVGDGESVPAFGTMYRPAEEDSSTLRQQQEDFARVRHELDRENSWMAIPALAPVAAVAAAEGVGGLLASYAARFGRPLPPGPLVLTRPGSPRGNSYLAEVGKRAHSALRAKVRAKTNEGWASEPHVLRKAPAGGYAQPDLSAPVRASRPDNRYQLELKPNTPRGRQTARTQVRRYFRETGNKTRAIFYDPKDFP